MSAAGEMHVPRVRHTDTMLTDGTVLLAGGIFSGAGNQRTATAELYDPRRGTFTPTAAMTMARRNHTASLLEDGLVLVTGGRAIDASSAELHNPASGTWSATASMVTPRFRHTATELPNGLVLVAAGVPGPAASAELYDPAIGGWTLTGPMNVARADHAATLLLDGRVLVTGGTDSVGQSLASAEIFDPASGTWELTRPMSQGRDVHTATRLKSGDVLVAGGQQGTGEDLVSIASAERYDVASRNWIAVADMRTDRGAGHTATLTPDGDVLVAGGLHMVRSTSDFRELASSEVYDPKKDTWTATDSLDAPRYGHTATLLRNNRVLVTGGWTSAPDPIRSAELYQYGR